MDTYDDFLSYNYFNKLAKKKSSLLYDLSEKRLFKKTCYKKNKINTKSILVERRNKYY